MALIDPAKTAKPKGPKIMNAQTNSYKVKSSANRAAKKALGHDQFTIIENADGTFSWVEDRADGKGGTMPTPGSILFTEEQPPAEQSVQVDDAPEATPEQVAAIEQAGDNAANGLTVTEAPPAPKTELNVKRKSDIEKPTKAVWRLAGEKLAEDPNIRRKDMIDYLVGAGIAFYTARTQYQLYLAAIKSQAETDAAAAAKAAQ